MCSLGYVHGPRNLDLEAESRHAALVKFDRGAAILRRVGSRGKEHALIPLGLFLCADAARLGIPCQLGSHHHARGSLGAGDGGFLPWASKLRLSGKRARTRARRLKLDRVLEHLPRR